MHVNTNDSNAKEKIEDWYEENMTSYANKIDDVIYCNDRSMNNTNIWNSNGEGYSNEDLYYGGYLRAPYNGTATPSLSCINKNDTFIWKNSNGNEKLRYPVGMVTIDEAILAGGKVGYGTSYYLKSGQNYWTMSPYTFSSNNKNAVVFYIGSEGILNYGNSGVGHYYGLRPVISLKPGQLITKGSGTAVDPYVIE